MFGTTTTQAGGGLFGTQAQPATGGSSLFGGTGSTGFGTSGGFGTTQASVSTVSAKLHQPPIQLLKVLGCSFTELHIF